MIHKIGITIEKKMNIYMLPYPKNCRNSIVTKLALVYYASLDVRCNVDSGKAKEAPISHINDAIISRTLVHRYTDRDCTDFSNVAAINGTN